MDLTAWTQRAADELAATGATARPRRPLASEPLTSQETRVALLVAAVQPRGRRRPVPQPQDGRAPPGQRVPQARLPLPHRAGRRLRPGRRAALRDERAPDSRNLSSSQDNDAARASKVATTSSKALSNRCAACDVGDGQGGCRQTRWQRARSWQEPRKLRQLFPNGKVLSSLCGRTKGKGSLAFPLVRALLVGATGFEPVTSSVSANHQGTAVRKLVFPGRARPSGSK
jgi:hypothetical protein